MKVMAMHPRFEELKEEISKHIDDTSMSKSVRADLQEAEEALLEAKQYYYQQLVLFAELKEILRENNFGLSDQQYEEEKEESNPIKTLWEVMSGAEAKNCLNISMKGKPEKDERVFGLDAENFDMEPRQKKIIHQNIQQHCIPLIEKRLKNKCIELYKFWNPSNKDSEGLALAKANQMAVTVSNELDKLKELQVSLKNHNDEYSKLHKKFHKDIASSINEVEDRLKNVSEKPQLAGTKITSDWIAAKCDYILSKIRVMKNHIYGHTYNEETLNALHKVRYHLEQEIKTTQTDLQRTKQAILTYESIGDTFKQLLTQYNQLTMEIDNKKWALSELNKNKI